MNKKEINAKEWIKTNIGDLVFANTTMHNLLNYEYEQFEKKNEVLNDFFQEKKLAKLKFIDKHSDFNTLKENIETIVLKNEKDDREILKDFIDRSKKFFNSEELELKKGGSKTKRSKTKRRKTKRRKNN